VIKKFGGGGSWTNPLRSKGLVQLSPPPGVTSHGNISNRYKI